MSEVYRIGVSIMLRDGMSPVLSHLSRQLIGVHKSVKDIEGGFNRWKLAIGGAAAALVGSGMVRGVADLVSHAKEFSHELVQIEKLGVTAMQLKQVEAAAYAVTRSVPGTKEVEPLEIYGAGYSIFGHDNALKLMQPLAQFAAVMKNTTGKFEEDVTKQLYQMLRAGDLMGKFVDTRTHQVDIGKLTHFLDLGSRVMQATHGYVNAQTWLGLAQQGGPAVSGMTDKGMMEMAILAQGMGGPRAGTALMSTFSQLVGGIMFQRTAAALRSVGILHEGDYTVEKGGRVRLTRSASEHFAQELSDPLKFLTKDLIPAMEKHGITDIDSQVNFLYQAFQRQTSIRAWHDFLRNRIQIEGEVDRMGAGMNVNPAMGLANSKDLEQVMHNLTTSWDNLLTTIGKVGSGPAIWVMNALTGVLEKVNVFANAHPTAIKIIGESIAALGAVLTAVGVGAIVTALGAVGGVVAAVAGGAAVIGIAVLNWDKLTSVLAKIPEPFKIIASAATMAVAPLLSLGRAIMGLVHMIPGLGPAGGGPAIKTNPYSGMPQMPHGPLGPAPSGLGKQGYNAVPPANGGTKFASAGAIYMDGKKVGEIVTGHQARAANGPLQGSAYMDGTRTFVPADFAYARG